MAKQYGLQGKTEPPPACHNGSSRSNVQTLNRHVVEQLIHYGIHAMGISPCFGIPNLQAHGGGGSWEEDWTVHASLRKMVWSMMWAGFIPIFHGDACLYEHDCVGILSGDVLMELLGTEPEDETTITTTTTTTTMTVPFWPMNAIFFDQH